MPKTISNKKKVNIGISDIIITITILLIIITPYYRGLFNGGHPTFEGPIYYVILTSIIMLALMSVHFFKYWKFETYRDLLSILVWFIPLSYFISMINPASPHQAKLAFYISIVYATNFLVGSYFIDTKKKRNLINYIFIFIGYLLVLYGLSNWFGFFQYTDAVLNNRLSNVFQYPNSYAAFLIILLFINLFYIISLEKFIWRLVHAMFLVPIVLSFLLTVSRGALLILPIAFLVLLPLLTIWKQIKLMVLLGTSILISFFIYDPVRTIGIELNQNFTFKSFAKGSGLIALASVAVIIVVFCLYYVSNWIMKRETRENKSVYKNFVLPVILMAMGIIIIISLFNMETERITFLPDNLLDRIKRINFEESSISYRSFFIKDSIEIFRDYPIFGAGGGGWSALYEQYQSAPYTSRQAHSFYLQYLIEVGLFGLIILVGLLGLIFYMYFRNHFQTHLQNKDYSYVPPYIIVTGILTHSILDFDMSFVYLAMLVFLGLGIMASQGENIRLKLTVLLKKRKSFRIYPLLISFVVIISSFQIVRMIQAHSFYEKAEYELENRARLDIILENIDSAIELEPKNFNYRLLKTDVLGAAYAQTKVEKYYYDAIAIIEEYLNVYPNNHALLEKQYHLYTLKQDYRKAYENLIKQINLRKWNLYLFEKAITLNFDLGVSEAENGNVENEYWKESLRLYYDYIPEKLNQLEKMPTSIRILGSMEHIPRINLTIGKIKYYKTQFKEASELFKSSLSSYNDQSLQKILTRWYLASLEKQGESDDAVKQQFLQKYPEEEELIKNIVSSI